MPDAVSQTLGVLLISGVNFKDETIEDKIQIKQAVIPSRMVGSFSLGDVGVDIKFKSKNGTPQMVLKAIVSHFNELNTEDGVGDDFTRQILKGL